MMDDFRGDGPRTICAGFPWHPHRGIETITYVLAGEVDHGDSLGNRGKLGSGDVQWMTAGSGILHQEMPTGDAKGRMHGFQLWANLPVAPQDDQAALPGRSRSGDPRGDRRRRHARARHLRRVLGQERVRSTASPPSRAISTSTVPPGKKKRLQVEDFRQAFAYIFEGSGDFDGSSEPFGVLREAEVDGEEVLVRDKVGNRSLVVFGAGDEVVVQAGEEGVRFLLVSGRPIREPIAWHGPIVMNTQDEIRQAVSDLRNGAFIKHG